MWCASAQRSNFYESCATEVVCFHFILHIVHTYTHVECVLKLLEKGTHFALISYGFWQTCATNNTYIHKHTQRVRYPWMKSFIFVRNAHPLIRMRLSKKFHIRIIRFSKQIHGHWLCVCVGMCQNICTHTHDRASSRRYMSKKRTPTNITCIVEQDSGKHTHSQHTVGYVCVCELGKKTKYSNQAGDTTSVYVILGDAI